MCQGICGSQIIIIRSVHLTLDHTQDSGAGKGHDKINDHSYCEGLKVCIQCTCHALGRIEKFYRTDNGKYTGIFDIDDQVIADLDRKSTRLNSSH